MLTIYSVVDSEYPSNVKLLTKRCDCEEDFDKVFNDWYILIYEDNS